MFLLLAQRAFSGRPSGGGNDAPCLGQPRAAAGAASEPEELAATVPCALFGALLCQGVLQLSVNGAARRADARWPPPQYTAWPCVGVHALTLLYYALERTGAACAVAVAWRPFGGAALTVRPLHHVLWICSVSSQVITLFCVEREIVGGLVGDGGAGRAPRVLAALLGAAVGACAAHLDA